MKKLINLAVLFVALCFGACNKCNDTSCENGSVCYDGSCQCPEGFSGDNCENEWRDAFIGSYILTGQSIPDSSQFINITKDLTKGNRVLINNFFESPVVIQAYVVEDEIYFDEQTWGLNQTIQGFGTEINGQLNISLTITSDVTEERNIIAKKVN